MKKKLLCLLLLPLFLTACGTSPKKTVNQALDRVGKVDSYQEIITIKEAVTVLSKKNSRNITITTFVDNEHQVEKKDAKIKKDTYKYEETSYVDKKNNLLYEKDKIDNLWVKNKIEEAPGILDFSILKQEKIKVKEIKSNDRVNRKYKIELTEEDMKRLFYRQIHDEYISMRVNSGGTIYIYVNRSDYLTKIEIDLTKLIDMRDPDTSCDKLKITLEYLDYNNLEAIKIPVDVQKSAVQKGE